MDPFPAWGDRLRASDPTVCAAMFDALHVALLRYALHQTKEEDAAYKAVQEAFIALWKSRHTIDPERPLQDWLYTLVRNQAQNDPHLRWSDDVPAVPPDDALPSFAPDPSRVKAMRKAIGAAILTPARPLSIEILGGTVPRHWAIAAGAVLLLAVVAWLWLQPVSLHAPAGETLTTSLPDGSTVMLNSGARLAYAQPFNWGARSVRLTGEAVFEVMENTEKPFTVETFNARITATMGHFNVRAWPTDPAPATTLVTVTGESHLAPLRAPSQTVTPTTNQISTVGGDEARPSTPIPVSSEQTLSWQQGGFFFSDHLVEAILAEVERRFGKPVQAPKALAQQRMGLYLKRAESPEAVLDALCGFLACHHRATPTGYELRAGTAE